MNEVDRWLEGGAGVPEGLRLLSQYEPSPRLERLVTAAPERFSHLLVSTLSKYASNRKPLPSDTSPEGGKRFREEWPFLSDQGCPAELKILAADKITAWYNIRTLHEKLFSCSSLEDCFETAKKLLKNFEENRQITAEFTHYKEHHRVLGKHSIFKKTDRFSKYRAMSIVALIKEEKRLSSSIWRDESEIRKGDKPHLEESRQARLEEKRSSLAYVRELISEYERAQKKK